MRWPSIFFKNRKRREHAAIPSPEQADNNRTGGGRETIDSPPGPITRVVPLAESSPPGPIIVQSDVDRAMAEADPISALTRTGGLRLSKRRPLESSISTGPILIRSSAIPAKTEPIPAFVPTLPAVPAVIPSAAADPIVPAPVNKNLPDDDSPFILPPDSLSPATAGVSSTTHPAANAINLRRKARMTDVARIVAPVLSNEASSAPTAEPPGAVVPPAFTIAVEVGSLMPMPGPESGKLTVPPEESKTREQPVEMIPDKMEPSAVPDDELKPEKKADKPEVKPETKAIETESSDDLKGAGQTGTISTVAEKKEFLLANGERLYGRVLSESPDAIYLDHATLGVLTLPRAQIAQRPVEIILINGDRIVGDILAENPDTLFVRHASLGMLTVPRAHRSTRVVEAILKDGDRILGEVMAETETFTVIRSATLGTVSVPHNKVALLNRKLEQMELKSLAPVSPELKDKSA